MSFPRQFFVTAFAGIAPPNYSLLSPTRLDVSNEMPPADVAAGGQLVRLTCLWRGPILVRHRHCHSVYRMTPVHTHISSAMEMERLFFHIGLQKTRKTL